MLKFLHLKSGLFSLIMLSVIFSININAQKISDIISTVNLNSGTTDTLLLSDMFYAPNYSSLKLIKNNSISGKLNSDKSKLLLTPDKNFEGLTLVSFDFAGEDYSIPVQVNKAQLITFTFNPGKKYNKVFLFGSFNSWNRASLEMQYENGEYKISIPLDPGRYQYKFFVDGSD